VIWVHIQALHLVVTVQVSQVVSLMTGWLEELMKNNTKHVVKKILIVGIVTIEYMVIVGITKSYLIKVKYVLGGVFLLC
jgi:hypothetical protein